MLTKVKIYISSKALFPEPKHQSLFQDHCYLTTQLHIRNYVSTLLISIFIRHLILFQYLVALAFRIGLGPSRLSTGGLSTLLYVSMA